MMLLPTSGKIEEENTIRVTWNKKENALKEKQSSKGLKVNCQRNNQ